MATVESPSTIMEELAGLLSESPDREELLKFQPSEAVKQRAQQLLDRMQNDDLSQQEEKELEQFQNVELLMRLVKAKLHAESQS